MNLPVISILGCGWLGLPLAAELVMRGYSVKGSTTHKERFSELIDSGVQPYYIKSEQGNWLHENIIDFLTCDILIISIPPNTKKNKESTHADEIKHLLQLIADSGIKTQTIIYVSSTSIYKDVNRVVEEDDVSSAEESGNIVLAEAEYFIKHSDIPNKLILRLGGLTGYNRMLAKFYAGKKDVVGGNQPVNLLHRDDAVKSIIFLLTQKVRNEVFNVCSPKHPVKRDFYTELCRRFDLDLPDFPESLDSSWKEVSVKKLKETGYIFIFPDPELYSY